VDWVAVIVLAVVGNVLSTLITDAIRENREKRRRGLSS
jgi:hypothetical protein